jgi:large subunit ribosomal protein L3
MHKEKAYTEGLLGTKLGMTQYFTESGDCVPVTVIKVGPCVVLDVKETEKDGYSAVALGFKPKKQQRVSKAELGQFNKAAKGCFYHVKEMRCDVQGLGWAELGKELAAKDLFVDGDFVDVTGTSLGRGFQGVFKRHHMRGQPSTRGTHEVRRHVGSIGCRKTPGRVYKGKRMPGHMGNLRVTTINLKVVAVNQEENVIFVKGAVPGPKGCLVEVRKAVKKMLKKAA